MRVTCWPNSSSGHVGCHGIAPAQLSQTLAELGATSRIHLTAVRVTKVSVPDVGDT